MFVDRFNLRFPLILAPMAGGPTTPELVAAVCNAGGLGSVAGPYLKPDELEKTIHRTRALTQRPFAVNLFAPCPDPKLTPEMIQKAQQVTETTRAELGLRAPELEPPFGDDFIGQFQVLLRTKPAAFSFTFGLVDSSLLKECRQQGIFTMGTATTLEEALALEESGVDAVIAQGVEAGGHRGLFSADQEDPDIALSPLVAELVKKLRVPVIAAGGLMNGAAIKAVLDLGAQAAQLGTAFLLCPEAGTSKPYRRALANPDTKTTRLTRAFSGRWARGIENRFLLEMALKSDSILPFPAQNVFTRDIRRASAAKDMADFLSLWAGQGVDLIREMPAAELVETLFREWQQ